MPRWDLQIIIEVVVVKIGMFFLLLFCFTLFLKDSGSMGSSAAKEMDESRMKRRMMLVKVVALMMRWQSFRNLDGVERIRMAMSYHEA